jgi:hypothetical protein
LFHERPPFVLLFERESLVVWRSVSEGRLASPTQ